VPYLPAIPPVPRSVLVALGFAAGVIAVWLWARISRTRRVIIQANESVQTLLTQLERIANAMDRIALSTEAREISARPRLAKEVKDVL
jgi:hypothetical protein